MIPRRLIPGEQFDQSARSQGNFTDAVKALRAKQMELTRGDVHTHVYTEAVKVTVDNTSGENVPWYGVLELGDPKQWDGGVMNEGQCNAFQQQVYLLGSKPGSSWLGKTYGIAQEPINADCVGEMLIMGLTQVKVYYPDEDSLNYHYAIPIENDVKKLQATPAGPIVIYWSEKVVGESWALVSVATIVSIHVHFELYDALTPGEMALAYPRWYDVETNQYVTDVDDDKSFYVSDILGLHRGRAREAFDSPHNEGSFGEAR